MYPIIYLIAKDERPSYLMATVHVGVDAVGSVPEPVFKLIRRCRAFYSEVVRDVSFDAEPTVADVLETEQQVERYKGLLARYGVDLPSPDETSISRAYEALLTGAMPRFSGEILDFHLARRAEEMGVEALGIELPEEHFDMIGVQDILINTVETLHYDERGTRQVLGLAVQAFRGGHATVLEQLFSGMAADKPEKLRDWELQRTQAMARSIMRDTRPCFYAIGASHVVGKHGIVEALRVDHRVTVERLFFDYGDEVAHD